MTITKILLLSGMLASLGMLASCANDDLVNGRQSGGDKGAAVTFHVSDAQNHAGISEDLTSQKLSVEGANDACLIETTVAGIRPVRTTDKAQTRSNITTTATLGHFSSIGYRGTTSGNLEITPWFYNQDTDSNGNLITPMLWSWGKPYGKFYAVAPQVTTGYGKIALSPADHSGTPYVDFEVEPDVENQKDLMTACSGEIHYAVQGTAPVTNLRFRHALTAVRFKVGQNLSWNKTISKVEIINAKSKGRYTLPTDENGTDAGWDNLSDPQTFTLDGISVSTAEAVNNIIMGKNNDNYVFYMIPQPLSGVSVKIHFADGSTPITANLSGTWKPGTTKTYALTEDTSDWNYVLTVTNPTAVAYDATASDNYTIQSYRKDPGTGTQQPVAWKVVGYQESIDGGTTFGTETIEKPAWLTALSIEEGNGGTAAESGTATIEADNDNRLAAYNKVLQEASAKGSAGNYYDLSTHDANGNTTQRNTANCYLVSAPGYYKIPLVYGNAIKGGSNNTGSYQTSVSGANVLQNFKDHAGQNITDPWITRSNNGANVPDGAKIVWTDQSGIVTDFGLEGSGTNAFVHFRVPQDKIKNGNAVIAVTKGGTVVWSWHLWFNHKDVLDVIPCTNFQGKEYKFTKQTLGFAYRKWNGSTYDKPRVVRLKVEQTVANGGTKKFAYIDITQNSGSEKEISSTFYQFGRKDAMPGIDVVADGSFNLNGGDKMSVQRGMQHPEIFYTWGRSWYNNYNWCNLWSMENTTNDYNDNPVVKTVYDPCPVGFHMPASNAFTGFVSTGTISSTQSQFNISGDWDLGWHFYNKKTNPDATIYFPATGYRYQNDGTMDNSAGKLGSYWTAISEDTYRGYWMYFIKRFLYTTTTSLRAAGYAVRPVAE